jgi:type II secretory pathway pseudopilin PulG
MVAFIEESSSLKTVLDFLQPLLLSVVAIITAWGISLAKARGDRAEQKAEHVAEVAAETAQTTQEQNAQILKTTDKVHVLVNSQMGQQLMMYAITARTLANLTKDPEHIKAADEADKKLAQHQLRQSLVDDKEVRQGGG